MKTGKWLLYLTAGLMLLGSQGSVAAPFQYMIVASGVAQRLNYSEVPAGQTIGTEGRLSYGVGLLRGVPLGQTVSAEFGLFYQERTSRVFTTFSSGSSTDVRWKFTSLDIPVQIRAYFYRELFSFGGGLIFSQGMGSVSTSSSSVTYDSIGIKKTNFQLVGGLSYQPKFGNKILMFGLQGTYGLSDLNTLGTGAINTTGLQFLLGFGI